MPSSANASPQRHSPSLPLNGKIQSRAPNNSSSGLPHEGLRTPQPSLGKPWLLTWTHSIQKSMDVGSYNTGMTCCWLPETKEKCWKGTKALLQLLMEAGYRVSKRKAQICKEAVRYPGFVLKKGSRLQTLTGSYILMALA